MFVSVLSTVPCSDDYFTPVQNLVLVIRFCLIFYCSLSMLVFALPLILLVLPLSLSAFRGAINGVVVPIWINSMLNIFPPLAVSLTGSRISRILSNLSNGDSSKLTQAQIRKHIMTGPGTKLCIANHTIDTDFLIIWFLLPLISPSALAGRSVPALSSLCGNVKIVLKDSLRALPVIGQGMKTLEFLFLTRSITADRINIENHFTKYLETTPDITVLIFPEGTTLNTRDVLKANNFAQKQSLPKLPNSNLLYPRATGFNLLSKSLLTAAPNASLLDLTMIYNGYSDDVPTYGHGYARVKDRRVLSVKKLLTSYNVRIFGLCAERFLWIFDAFVNKLIPGGNTVSPLYNQESDVTREGKPAVMVVVEEDSLKKAAGENYIYHVWQKKDEAVEVNKNQKVRSERRIERGERGGR